MQKYAVLTTRMALSVYTVSTFQQCKVSCAMSIPVFSVGYFRDVVPVCEARKMFVKVPFSAKSLYNLSVCFCLFGTLSSVFCDELAVLQLSSAASKCFVNVYFCFSLSRLFTVFADFCHASLAKFQPGTY